MWEHRPGGLFDIENGLEARRDIDIPLRLDHIARALKHAQRTSVLLSGSEMWVGSTPGMSGDGRAVASRRATQAGKVSFRPQCTSGICTRAVSRLWSAFLWRRVLETFA